MVRDNGGGPIELEEEGDDVLVVRHNNSIEGRAGFKETCVSLFSLRGKEKTEVEGLLWSAEVQYQD